MKSAADPPSLILPVHQAGEVVLVTGPARSGKSAWAEGMAERSPYPVTYVATARRVEGDDDWNARIQQHRDRRPSHWQTQEVPEALVDVLGNAQTNQCLLIDSLGTWVANWLESSEDVWQRQVQVLVQAMKCCPAFVILVVEETGWGVIPAYALGRRFRDRLGQLSQNLGQRADGVYLCVAGHALPLHQLGYPLPSMNPQQ